ncbi:nucleotide kinase domain-containing protein [Lentzea flaviverrucosa]|uniref:5-hmdU DNA kinase helical domain-containing protein n=1 Tax=Lentzea flaviverrucosa TaxID=200379 RepID=A0A1H9XYL4_9PSEU|nr:nucleotide kinase domain-containing protein [Lentzea flaviverrucosa]RDI16348.1 hypothetical protein DFR72_1264 [Lentzea flaviverrucosa]SES51242.1 hypothetical protein SAMN05216195_1304 [Lentzea flaviverrucosa]
MSIAPVLRTRPTESRAAQPLPAVTIAGRRLQPTVVFDTYWHFAVARQRLYFDRITGRSTSVDDDILSRHRFTNCYRATDRVSQFGIRSVAYGGPQEPQDVVFRTLLFKFFNKIETWELLESTIGPISWRTWREDVARAVLDAAFKAGRRLYSAAYVIPPPPMGAVRKHANHLQLLSYMMNEGLPNKLTDAASMRQAYEMLLHYPGIGRFIGYQLLIDLNYSSVLNFNEGEYIVAGPGARDGIRKCFGPASHGIEEQVIEWVTETQQLHFNRLGLDFETLGGRPLQLIDCQNLFCEVDKYARVAHPEVTGLSGRQRIKQNYRQDPRALTPWFPPKWGIEKSFAQQVSRYSKES